MRWDDPGDCSKFNDIERYKAYKVQRATTNLNNELENLHQNLMRPNWL